MNQLEIKQYPQLPDQAFQIRKEVFIEEQGFHDEFDHIDTYATHFVAYLDGQPVGTCRVFPDDEHPGTYHLGRMAIRADYRRHHIGAALIQAAETHLRTLGVKTLLLSAQQRALGFYRKQQYTPQGQPYLDEHYPHQLMKKDLK